MPDRNSFLPVSVPQIRAHSPGSEQALNYHSHGAYHATNGPSHSQACVRSLHKVLCTDTTHTHLMTLTSPSLPTDLCSVTKGPPVQNWKLHAKAQLLYLFLIWSCLLLSEPSLSDFQMIHSCGTDSQFFTLGRTHLGG